MARLGASQIYDPRIERNRSAKIFLRIFGSVDASSSPILFKRIVKKVDKDFNCRRVLDAGCGKGKYSFWLAQEYQNIIVDACDFAEDKIDLCRRIQHEMNTHNINFFVQDLRTYKKEGNYDFVFSNHVLEHIAENRLVISNLVDSLKLGGYIYIQIPNAVQKRLPFGKNFLASYDEWDRKEHIGQTLTLESLSSELQGRGCKVLIARYIEGFWGELAFELEEMALGFIHSRILFAALYPLLKTLGYIDSLANYSEGNGILVLARKETSI